MPKKPHCWTFTAVVNMMAFLARPDKARQDQTRHDETRLDYRKSD